MNTTATKQRRRNHRRGIRAEYLSLLYLILKTYRPLAIRYKTPIGEIDLIMKRGNTIAFIEVKHRRKRLDAAQAVHHHNQSRVLRASQYFIAAHPEFATHQLRFDVCLVAWYRLPHHIPHAFTA